jgi:hypothetical protein
MTLYTDVGPLSGPLLSGTGYLAIRVLHARRAPTPIGAALLAGQGRDAAGRALWRLTIDTIDLPGFWVVVDREFRPAPRGRRRPRGRAGRPRVPSIASLSRRDHNRPLDRPVSIRPIGGYMRSRGPEGRDDRGVRRACRGGVAVTIRLSIDRFEGEKKQVAVLLAEDGAAVNSPKALRRDCASQRTHSEFARVIQALYDYRSTTRSREGAGRRGPSRCGAEHHE